MHTTKYEQLKEYMAQGDWHKALRLAAKFPQLGEHKKAIQQGWEALARPDNYRQMGHDPDTLIQTRVAALKERYGQEKS